MDKNARESERLRWQWTACPGSLVLKLMALTSDRLPPPSVDLLDMGLAAFVEQLRARDRAFAEVSSLYPDDMGEWQAAVYLLSGCETVWRVLGAAVLAERSMAPIISEIGNARRAWSASETEVMAWAAHFWEFRRNRADFPFAFGDPLFDRWVVALHLRKGRGPARA